VRHTASPLCPSAVQGRREPIQVWLPCQAALPSRLWRDSRVPKPARNASASAMVEFQPKLTRRAQLARSLGTPMAARTWLAPTLPDEHAEPDETDRPIRSSAIIAVALPRSGTAKLVTLPIRFV